MKKTYIINNKFTILVPKECDFLYHKDVQYIFECWQYTTNTDFPNFVRNWMYNTLEDFELIENKI